MRKNTGKNPHPNHLGLIGKYYDLYHYNENKIGKKFHGGQISAKKVKKAREALKVW